MYNSKLKPWFFGTLLLFVLVLTPIFINCQSTLINAQGIKAAEERKQTSRFAKTIIESEPSSGARSRQKRLLWITSDGRLALPPGTTLVVTPSLSLPFVRYPPNGFFSNLTISLPFTIDFNKLGLTDNENPFGVLPPLFARSMGREAANILGEYIMQMLQDAASSNSRSKRSTNAPTLSEKQMDAFHGGERALLYIAAQELIQNFGLDGKACLLRAICEIHARPMKNFGLFGEMLKLFLTASKSPYSVFMREYIDAEEAGSGKAGPSECWPYLRNCPKSLFVQNHNKYSKTQEADEDEDLSPNSPPP